MTERITYLKKHLIKEHQHKAFRKPERNPYFLATQFHRLNMKDTERATKRLVWMLNEETPLIIPGQTILLLRTNPTLQALFTKEEKEALAHKYRLHELGELSNICVDYTYFLNTGFTGMIHKLENQKANSFDGQIEILTALLNLVTRYRDVAFAEGYSEITDCLTRLLTEVPHSFQDALQMMRIIHFAMWCGGNYHNTLGRFDQYMMPYLQTDLDSGILTEETALELLEEYFLSFNFDSDLYPGMQQGDNGQSMVLGGITPDGKDGFNLLSRLCLQASLELQLIDPKINLRVNKDTPLSVYKLGTQLTKQGLGFPQYSNDDIVIKGLTDLGYSLADARNYAVAACWEFIIPGKGMDIPNIDALCFATEMRNSVVKYLSTAPDYESLFIKVKENIQARVDEMCRNTKNLYIFPAPFLSLMMDGCLESGRDISLGGVYNNYGFHGVGLATAADSLAAIRKYIFETGEITKEELLNAIEHDFEGYDRLLHLLRYKAPKFGNNEQLPDLIAGDLLKVFSEAVKGKKNERGGCYRAGTGSAMYYLWYSKEMGATPDGRRAGEGFSCNYSPSLFIHSKGPVSIIKSFTKPDLSIAINGGPLTIELHDTLFRNEESMTKVAALVKSYIDLGGHQMQINAVNRDTMLDAQKHPENYHNLIVRVWGWSGYFVELDKEYQDHIIKRMELTV